MPKHLPSTSQQAIAAPQKARKPIRRWMVIVLGLLFACSVMYWFVGTVFSESRPFEYWVGEPTWSPDARQIAFVSNRVKGSPYGGLRHIYVVDANGSNLTELTSDPFHDLVNQASTNLLGNYVAFYVDLFSRGTQAEELDLAWSPDGKRIAFLSGSFYTGSLFVMNADGSHRVQLANSLGPFPNGFASGSLSGENLAWSPDGKHIAFISGMDPRDVELSVIDADGAHRVDFANTSGFLRDPAWSPDSKRIAFVALGIYNPADHTDRLELINADGTNLVEVAHEHADRVSWSPNGHSIAFRTGYTAKVLRNILIVSTDGSNKIENPNDNIDVVDGPTWLPDGSHITFYGNIGDDAAIASLYRMNADGTDIVKISDEAPHSACFSRVYNSRFGSVVGMYSALRWSPDGSHIAFSDGQNLCAMGTDGANGVELTGK